MLTRLLLKIVFGNYLNSFLYIGARDQDSREKKAAAEIEHLLKTALEERRSLTPEEQQEVQQKAEQYGVSAARVEILAGQMASPPKSYGYSPGKAQTSNVILMPSGKYEISETAAQGGWTATIGTKTYTGSKQFLEQKAEQFQEEYQSDYLSRIKTTLERQGKTVELSEGKLLITEPPPTTAQEFQKSLFTKMGYSYEETPSGLIELGKEGRKQIIDLTRYGHEQVADIPSTATYYKGFDFTPTTDKKYSEMNFFEKALAKYNKVEGFVSEKVKRSGIFDVGFIKEEEKKAKERLPYWAGKIKEFEYKDYNPWLTEVNGTKQLRPIELADFIRWNERGVKNIIGEPAVKYFKFWDETTGKGRWYSPYSLEKGYRLTWLERPVKKGVTAGAFFILPGLLKPLSVPFYRLPKVVTEPFKWVVGIGLPTLYGQAKYSEVKETPKSKKGEQIGRIISGEIEPMIVGSYAGQIFWSKAYGFLRTLGRERIPPEKIIHKDVLSSEELFKTSTEPHLKYFQEGKYQLPKIKGYEDVIGSWHAESTSKPSAFSDVIYKGIGKAGVITVGARELPGGYVSPSLSPYFLRTVPEGAYGFSGVDLFAGGMPTAAFVYPKGYELAPYKTQAGLWDFLIGKAPKGYAYTHPASFKSELEAIIPPGTIFTRLKSPFYTVWKGVRVPIEQYSVAGVGDALANVGKNLINIMNVPYTSGGGGAVTSPFVYGLASSLSKTFYQPPYKLTYEPSYKPEYRLLAISEYEPYYKPSYKPSYVPAYKPAYQPTYKTSYKPSYKPEYEPPYTPAYQPPYTPTYEPPYQPPYKPPYTPAYEPPYQPPYQPPYTPPYQPPYQPPYEPPAYGVKTKSKAKYEEGYNAYDVYAKDKETFSKLNKSPLTREGAMNLGAEVVDNTSSARFKIKGKRSRYQPDDYTGFADMSKFRSYARRGSLKLPLTEEWIEHSENRIDTPGELQGITVKGWKANREKSSSLFGSLDLGFNEEKSRRSKSSNIFGDFDLFGGRGRKKSKSFSIF